MNGVTDTYCLHSDKELENEFESLFKTHNQSVYLLALKVTKSHQQACDIMQDVFVKLWEMHPQWGEIRNFEAWLHRVTRNRLIDFLRKTAADHRLQDKLWNSMEQQDYSADSALDLKDSTAKLQLIVDKLPPQRRLVYQLSRDKGLSYTEIADELSISRHTVKNQLSHALRFLQKKLSLE
ncbi:RNA polymerase sigma-70 factor [Flavihumibacter sp. CACIAM 22H1]|uniref:RNA polymerase sigma factor n=1 Tax=Flavihumibacter sp. CACIAM 22H1 TaxID=1812911 RepID=UPI0007A8526E|nr:RNA polymerase sigma-70 factor [Flavihumibacter sp. CACIAM 22H1]KYP15748.1 MAG: hypothetical protein A1D16_05250 [Flavihumibacter sp. CACIAM 22H1]